MTDVSYAGSFVTFQKNAYNSTKLSFTCDMIPPEQLPRSENAFSELARQGAYQQFIGKVRKKDGTFVDIEVSSSAIIDNGRIIGSRDIIRDITERTQRAEDERRRSERMLQTIIDAEPECVKLLDENANLIMMNRAGLDMLQADSLDQVKGQCVCPMITSEYSQAFLDLTRQVFQGKSGTLLFEMIGMKGRHVWLETNAVPLRNEKDEIVALLGVTRDVTERIQQAEKRFVQSEARFRSIIERASIGILVADIETRKFLYANPEICRLLGYSAQEFLSLHGHGHAFLLRNCRRPAEGFQAHAEGKLNSDGEDAQAKGRLYRQDEHQQRAHWSSTAGPASWGSSRTSPRNCSSRRSGSRRRSSSPSGRSPAASPTTSTISCRASSAISPWRS